MAKRRSVLEYPVTIRQVDGFLIFTVKDLNISLVEELPAGGKLTPDFMKRVMATLAKSWIKSNERLKVFVETGRALPEPSRIRVAVEEAKKSRPLTAPQVAKLLGVSENTIRRIPKSQLRYRKTKGGHRRYSIAAVKLYQTHILETLQTDDTNSEQPTAQKPTTQALLPLSATPATGVAAVDQATVASVAVSISSSSASPAAPEVETA